MVLFSFFFFTWPDRSYLNQPRSESDVSPRAALRSPSCASSDRRGANPSPSAGPSVAAEWNKRTFFLHRQSSGQNACVFVVVKPNDKGFLKRE